MRADTFAYFRVYIKIKFKLNKMKYINLQRDLLKNDPSIIYDIIHEKQKALKIKILLKHMLF